MHRFTTFAWTTAHRHGSICCRYQDRIVRPCTDGQRAWKPQGKGRGAKEEECCALVVRKRQDDSETVLAGSINNIVTNVPLSRKTGEFRSVGLDGAEVRAQPGLGNREQEV